MPSRSLFWTFAGVFLLVLAVATALQIFVSAGMLRPIAAQHAREQAELGIERASRRLIELPTPLDHTGIIPLLREHMPEDPAEILVFSMREGPVVPDRRLDGPLLRSIAILLAREGLADSSRSAMPPPRGPLGPGAGPLDEPFGRGPPRGGTDGGPFDGPPAAGLPDPPRAASPGPLRSLELIAHRAVVRDGVVLGELAVVGPATGATPWSLPGSRSLLLFLPLAVLVSGAAALLMVRLLVRRLRALERAASRVIEGDLDARIEERGLDEIGRLEERFNRMTDRLAAARGQLEETDRQRRTLLADITHELATPLTSIRGYVETLLDPKVQTTAEERVEYLNHVLGEAKRLDLMIGELFELARLEAGATPLKPVRLDLSALCRNTARRLEPRFTEARLELVTAGDADPLWVRADGRRLEQVVENLLVNALRYVPAKGHVWMTLERIASATPQSGAGRLRLTVSDDGPGISPADLPHVFERFYRAETVRSMGGTGLGLAIVREIVNQHGGEVRAERREPRGAILVVELPADME